MTESTVSIGSESEDLAVFESFRPDLIALAYRMLGDAARAQDIVQDAWLRWHGRDTVVETPKAFLVTVVTRLCLNELTSARVRREETRGDRLPEPVDLRQAGMERVEALERVSMAFMVALERLTPAERAVLLLHEVFDFSHDEIAELVARTPAACRKLLERARRNVAEDRRLIAASREEHERLLHAFVRAASAGDTTALVELLSADAVLITDGGAEGRRYGRVRNLRVPLHGAAHIAAFISAASAQVELVMKHRELNGSPALVLMHEGRPFAAMLVAVADGKIHRVYFHADLARLRFIGQSSGETGA
jgi:RNA polymerase sigma-70 factor (ECF subfamily)